uniref:Uncharacterized protein n=1 Tax=Arundo donax TaxID=35708 RepID=A0A0A9CLU8_ARUDO
MLVPQKWKCILVGVPSNLQFMIRNKAGRVHVRRISTLRWNRGNGHM